LPDDHVTPPVLEVRDAAKRFGPVVALRRASLVVAPGEVHALLGANGAGKSTLVKMITGVLPIDSGTFTLAGRPLRAGSPAASRRAGISSVFQDPALVPDLSIAENLRLTRTNMRALRGWLARLELEIDLADNAGDVPLPLLRMLDFARAVSNDPKLLILDEITAALPADLAERVLAVARDLRERGRSVLFITHRLAEVVAMCDRATVLRDGVDQGVVGLSPGSEARIVELMLGAEVAATVTSATEAGAAPVRERVAVAGPPALDVRDLRVDGALDGVSLTVRRGEIVGVAALDGQGQDELFACLSGQRRPRGGEIVVDGRALNARSPYDAIRRGVVLVPGDRMRALLPQRPIRESLTTPLYNRITRWGPVNVRLEKMKVAEAVKRLRIDTRAQRQVRRLSGGNQQKVTIGRWLVGGFSTLLCFDPTRGIDVGTKRQIYSLLRQVADDGAAVLVFSSELQEVPLICDRVVVVWEGHISDELPASDATEARLLRSMHGLAAQESAA
jgi:ribose transport system ATP-binding protein